MLLYLKTQVHKFVRKNDEKPRNLVEMLKVQAFANENVVRADYHPPGCQSFAMNLIINSKLGEQVLFNPISNLIKRNQQTGKKGSHVSICRKRVENTIKAARKPNWEVKTAFLEILNDFSTTLDAHLVSRKHRTDRHGRNQ